MSEKVALLALCFAYSSDRKLRLEAVPKDLKKVFDYATWLGAKIYLVSDFVPESEGVKISERLGLSGISTPLEIRAHSWSKSPATHEPESANAKSVCKFVESIVEPYVIVYYSGHATNKSIVLPDGSRLPVVLLHQRLTQLNVNGICWILDGCELSGKGLRLPFLCREDKVQSVMPHGLHLVPTIALSSALCSSADTSEDESHLSSSEYEGNLRTEHRSYITDDNGSLFTSFLMPILTTTTPMRWTRIFGSLSKCCGFKDGKPVRLNLYTYISDASLSAVPFWMRKEVVERRGEFWIIHR